MGTFQHSNVGSTLTQVEFEGVDLHTVSGQSAGDMMYADSATSWERVAVGNNNEYLQLIAGVPTWGAVSVSVDANNLTGTILASGVVTSSLEAVGTVTTGTWTADVIADEYGGTGQSVSRALLAEGYNYKKWPKLILAGGLDPENVSEAIRLVRPWGVDTASGVEMSDQTDESPKRVRPRKDHLKIQDFVQAARRLQTT